MIPPIGLYFRVQWFRIWLPLFLLWPLFLLLAPLLALAGLFIGRPIAIVAWVYGLLCALRGLEIDVVQPDQTVKIYVT